MPNIDDVDDAFLSAKAEVDEFFEEFNAEWYRPYAEMTVMMMMEKIPPEIKEQLKKMAPAAYKDVEDMLNQIGRKDNA